jgi:hypothetical protein
MSNRYTAPLSLLFVDPDIEDRASWIRRLASSSPDYFVTTAEYGRTALTMCGAGQSGLQVSSLVPGTTRYLLSRQRGVRRIPCCF